MLAALLSAVPLVLFWQTAWHIGQTWYSSRTFSHGFLVVPVFFYLVWMRRGRLAKLAPIPNFWVLPVLALVVTVWLAGTLADMRVVQEFALVAALEAMLWILLGTAVVRALWFPLAFLFFAVPFGEGIIGPLQDFTAHFAVTALRLSRIPVILENRTIWVPSGPWIVAEACSGIRYLISSLVVGLVYASLVYQSRKRRVLFVLASLVVPVVANGFRAYGIIVLAYLTDNRLAAGVDHIVYGWIFFTAIQIALFSLGLRWREAPPTAPGLPDAGTTPSHRPGSSRAVAAATACALLLISSAAAAESYLAKRAAAVPASLPTAVVVPPWQAVSAYYDHGWTPLLHPSSQFSARYVSGGQSVDLYLARFQGNQELELVRGYNRISEPKSWTEITGGFRNVLIEGHPVKVRWDTIQSEGSLRLVWTWYWIGGTSIGDPTMAKLVQAKARLEGQSKATAVVTVSSGYLLESSEAASRLQEFLQHTSITPLSPHSVQ